MELGEDCGVWGTRANTADSLQNIKVGSRRAEFDPRLEIDHVKDIVMNKRMASPFHETNLQSLMVWHQCDTVVLTGGSTSGCVRACVVDAISRGYGAIVPEECVADKHESPHFAKVFPRMRDVAMRCIEEDGAEVICLGSTTMHQAGEYLAANLPVPVVNPGPLTYKLVETFLALGLTHGRDVYPPPVEPRLDMLHAMMKAGALAEGASKGN